MWSYGGAPGEKGLSRQKNKKGQFWRATMIDSDTQLRVASSIAKIRNRKSVARLYSQCSTAGVILTSREAISDGWGGIEAMVEVYRSSAALFRGVVRATLKQPEAKVGNICNGQATGKRSGRKDWMQVIYSDETGTAAVGKRAPVIRQPATSRHFNSRLTRKTLAFSKTIAMHQAAATLEDAYYNLVRPHKTLRQEVVAQGRRWLPRTPAMASALTEHIWTVKELFSNIPVPIVNNT
ncbi:MAG: hypothetical protein H6667_09345 [Ardenticatenaceae bacterium]|nr:hypothetical protein [Ardenticatenaceae bacterium]